MARLNPYTGRPPHQGKAPHKPLLLLALMDAFEGGEITEARFNRSPGLVFRFQTYGAMVADRWPSKLYSGRLRLDGYSRSIDKPSKFEFCAVDLSKDQ